MHREQAPSLKELIRSVDPDLLRLMLITFFAIAGVGAYSSVLTPWYRSLGYQSAAQGGLNSILQISAAFAAAVGGILADTYGRKNLFLAGQICRMLVVTLLLATRSVVGIIAVSIARGLVTIQTPAQSALIASYTDKTNRATMLGAFQTASQAGQAALPLIAGLLADRYGVRVPFLLAFVLTLISLILSLYLKNDVPAKTRTSAGKGAAQEPFSVRLKRMFASDGKSRAVLITLLMAGSINGLANGAFNIVIPFWIMDRFTSTYAGISAIAALFSVGSLIVQPVGGRIADVRGRKGVMVWSATISIIAGVLIMASRNLWQLYSSMILLAITGNLASPAISAIYLEAVSDKDRATFSGLTTSLNSAGLALGGALAGLVYQFSPSLAWIGTLVAFMVSMPLYFIALKLQESAERLAPAPAPAQH